MECVPGMDAGGMLLDNTVETASGASPVVMPGKDPAAWILQLASPQSRWNTAVPAATKLFPENCSSAYLRASAPSLCSSSGRDNNPRSLVASAAGSSGG